MNKRLYRSRTDTVIGGVAAGLATYLNADPALIRIAWAILVVVTSGAGLVVYIVCWIVIPEEPETPVVTAAPATEPTTDPVTGEIIEPAATPIPAVTAPDSGSSARAGMLVGIGLVAIGAWFLLREYLPDINWGLLWPLVLVGIGALILVTSMRRRAG
jgi:phage shock protein PspC (stress-responsive transcriptional regulator)